MSEMTAGVVVDVETEPAAGLEPAEVAGEGTALNASDIAFEGGTVRLVVSAVSGLREDR